MADILILAAGLGTRMKSRRAKVLHELGGRPLIAHVCRTAELLNPRRIEVVVGHQADEVKKAVEQELGPNRATFSKQPNQRGTGDAVMAASSVALILSGDVPLVKAETLRALIENHRLQNAACSLLTVRLENPTGYGRVIRDDAGKFLNIVEQKDASEEERRIREINVGIY